MVSVEGERRIVLQLGSSRAIFVLHEGAYWGPWSLPQGSPASCSQGESLADAPGRSQAGDVANRGSVARARRSRKKSAKNRDTTEIIR